MAGRTPGESYRLHALAGALVGGGPVWHYLYVNHYPFGQVEATVLPLIGALVGTAVAVVGHRIGGRLEGLVFGALLFLFLDLQFDLDKRVPWYLLVGGCLAASFLLRGRRAALTSITLGVFYLASLPRSGIQTQGLAPARASKADLPVLVHIVLDEQWGVGGLRAEGDSATAAFLAGFYRERGFELFEAAYSRSSQTVPSLASELSLGQPPAFNPKTVAPDFYRSLGTIPYFERLRSAGYPIYVFQSSELDYCHASASPVAACETHSSNSVANTGHLRGDWMARAVQAGRHFLSTASHVYARFGPGHADWPVSWAHSVTGGGLLAFENARREIAGRTLGNAAYFIHALLPHRPVVVDAECRALGNRAGQATHPTKVDPSDSAWRATLAHEGDQIRCAHRALGELLATVDSAVGRDRSIIIVQGDHGSRLDRYQRLARPLGALDSQALNSQFSTLLAIRRPGVPGAVYSEPVPIQDFLWELVRRDFKGPVAGPWRHFVQDWPRDRTSPDTLRALTVAEMPWVRSQARATAMADSMGRD